MRPATGLFVFLALLGLLLQAGCAGVAVKPDPALGRKLFRQAEQLYATRQYRQALERLRQATPHLPADADLVLRRGELEEFFDDFTAAARTYRQGLQRTGERLNEIRYHLARLELRVLDHPGKARDILRQIPNWDWRHSDLQALLLLLDKRDPRAALRNLGWIPRQLKNSPDSAFAYFHLALAYRALGDLDRATEQLLLAIQVNRHQGLNRQIERFWNEIRNDSFPPAGRATVN